MTCGVWVASSRGVVGSVRSPVASDGMTGPVARERVIELPMVFSSLAG
jgi:hypothetical protein